jgi:hypothetical protein
MRAAIGAAIAFTDTTIELTSVKTDAINLDVLRLDRLHVLHGQQANWHLAVSGEQPYKIDPLR